VVVFVDVAVAVLVAVLPAAIEVLVTVFVAVFVGVIEAVTFILRVGVSVAVFVDVEFPGGYDGTSYVLEHPTTKARGNSVATIKQLMSFFIFTSL